jgi:hypothetical protein
MSGTYFIVPSLLAIFVSLLVVRAAGIALMMTGMERERARFQALSAFSGTGFTTREAESIINHPQRRRIVSWLIIMGNAGIVAVIVTATSSLVSSRGRQIPLNIIIFIAGAIVIYRIAASRGLLKKWELFIEGRLVKSRAFEETSTEDILHFVEGYGVVREIVTDRSLLVDRSLAEARLSSKGLLVLGIERGPRWIPIPSAGEVIRTGDRLVVYGPLTILKALLREGMAPA